MPSNHLILCHPLLLLPSIFPSIGSFLMSWLFTSGGQSIGVSASASVLPLNIQDWFPLGLTGWISLQSKGISRIFSNTTVQKPQFLRLSFLYSPTLTSIYMTTGKTIALTRWTFVGKVMSLLFNMLFSSKEQASFNFMAAVTICSDFRVLKNKDFYCFHCLPIYLPWSNETKHHDLSFLNAEFRNIIPMNIQG